MAEYKNILIAFDGSPQSAKALKTAESLAKHYDAQLTVAFVYDDSKERSVGDGTAVAPNTGTTTVEAGIGDRKSTRLNSSHVAISYAVFLWKNIIHVSTAVNAT